MIKFSYITNFPAVFRFDIGTCTYLLESNQNQCPELESAVEMFTSTWPMHCQSEACNPYEFEKCVRIRKSEISDLINTKGRMVTYCK